MRNFITSALGEKAGILEQSIYVFFLRALSALIAFLLTVVIARRLGPEESGFYFFAVSFVIFLNSFSSFGLVNASLKLVSIHRENLEYLMLHIRQIVAVVLAATFAVYLVLGIYVKVVATGIVKNAMISSSIAVVFLVLPFFSLMLIFSSVFQAIGKLTISMVLLGMGYQIIMLLSLLTLNTNSLLHVITIYAVSIQLVVLACMLYFYSYYRVNVRSSAREFSSSLTGLFALSCPMMISQVVSQVSNFGGHLLLSIYSTPENLAFISVCLRISIIMSFFVLAVNRVVAPKFARLWKEGDSKNIQSVIMKSNRLLLSFSFPIFILVLFFGREILSLFGEGFSAAYNALILIGAGQFIASITGTVVFLLQMTGHQKVVAKNVLISSIFSLVLGVILVPKLGLIGAAIMTFVSLSTINLLCYYSVFKLMGVNPAKFF